MTDRVVKVRLAADISNFTSSLAKSAAATKALGDTVESESRDIEKALGDAGARGADRLVRDAGGRLRNARGQFATDAEIMASGLDPVMERRGRESGGILAKGIRGGLVRNSPLIAAAVGGALAAGAPAALAGAAMLFGGIAGVAGAQSLEVRKAWTDLGDEIARGAVQDAAVVIPELVGMADDLGAAFQGLRPQLREAFEATAPLVETFTAALTGAAENAMPGLVRAVQAGEPVMAGFQSFMESVGTGVGEFFGGLADHAPAAGQAFASLGDIVEELLPFIGTLLGQGAELAQIVLPPLAAVIGVVADVAERLGPLLPAIVAGIAGMKIAQSVSTGLGSLNDRLANMGTLGATAATGVSSLSTWMGRLGGAAAVVTGAIALTSSAASDSERQIDEWAQAAARGGQQATEAFAAAHEQAGGWFGGIADWVNDLAGVEESYLEFGHDAVENLTARTREVQAAMSDTERAQQAVATAQGHVTAAIDLFGANSPVAIEAVARYEAAQRELERQEGETQFAIDGVTTAMLEQMDQALASIDSQFAYRHATNQLEDAQANLDETVRNLTNSDETLRTTQEDVERAQLDLEEASYRAAAAFGQQTADLSGLSTEGSDYALLIKTSMLEELYRLRDAAGPGMRAAIDTQIRALEQSGVALDRTGQRTDATRGRVNAYSDSVNRIPAYKMTRVDTNADDTRRRVGLLQKEINDLRGRTVTITVAANRAAMEIFRQTTNPNASISIQGGRAHGGAIHGPGGPTEDRAGLWALSNNEHVWTAREVEAAGGHSAVEALRREVLANGRGRAAGGPVGVRANFSTGPLERTIGDVFGMMKAEAARRAAAERAAAAMGPSPGGGGSLAGGGMVWQRLWATIRAAFPLARLNSSMRPGDPGYHGAGRAVDLGWALAPGGIGNSYMAAMNRWIHDNYGSRSAELIYNGLGDDRNNIKNGRPLAYSYATQLQHRNHVHWAMANGGIIGEPVIGMGMHSGGTYSFGERGPETVTPGVRSREFSGGGGTGGGPVVVNIEGARIVGTLDLGGGLEARIDGRLAAHNRGQELNGRSWL